MPEPLQTLQPETLGNSSESLKENHSPELIDPEVERQKIRTINGIPTGVKLEYSAERAPEPLSAEPQLSPVDVVIYATLVGEQLELLRAGDYDLAA